MKKTSQEVLDHIIEIYKGYSKEPRATTQPSVYERISKLVLDYNYRPEDLLIRETLIEHTGSLPIVATAIYPNIEDNDVNIGIALIMLAIHDIGELGIGDEITFNKQVESANGEKEYALSILDEYYHQMYEDMETRGSNTAKFAKAVDKMTPDIVDLLTPAEITVNRYLYFTKKQPREMFL